MKIAISGGTGFIGEPLARSLAVGNDVVILSRQPEKVRWGRGVRWDPPSEGGWEDEVSDADVVVNLAGENLAGGRWTDARKERLIASRLDATGALVRAMKRSSKHGVLISASGVNYYGSRGDEILGESSTAGDGFLAELTRRWEAAAMEASPVARVAVLRFGVVIDDAGGALAKMLLPFRLGLGGRVGNGRQWMSWIDRQDLVRFIQWVAGKNDASGSYNATSPNPVTNREFTRELGRALHRPTVIPIPTLPLRLVLGQMAEETLLVSLRVRPERALQEGFRFEYPNLFDSFEHALATEGTEI